MSMVSQYSKHWTRRELLRTIIAGGLLAGSGMSFASWMARPTLQAQTFIGQASTYAADIRSVVISGFRELGINPSEIKGKRILLKPNLVETHQGSSHINTHPLVVRGVIEAFLSFGAQEVLVGEGPGHRRDTLDVIETSGLADILYEDKIPFLNLNYENGVPTPNLGKTTRLQQLTFPSVFQSIDWIVSLAKLKTHHWAGATLSMKNLFGVMPGIYYGWPKNVLHQAGITNSILDINATLRPHFAIVDGIVGMEGDGPIMGTPIHSGVLVMGRNLPAVDATCARLMKINPHKVEYLAKASNWLGPIHEKNITQVGNTITDLHTAYALIDHIPAHQGLRLS
jgi:uncharacterized protein (DUF362 family)